MFRYLRLIHLLPALFTLALTLPVAGYRHMWQDEIETAESAHSIVQTGLPQTIYPDGKVAVNAGGFEIEEDSLHRIGPWLPFYTAAGGLALGQKIGLSPDASVRLPFILMHGATSSIVSYGLTAIVGFSPVASVTVGTLFGVQTVRLLYNRSARYQAILDILLAIGMLGIGLAARGHRRGSILLGCAVFLLPQVHTLGGCMDSSLLVLCAFLGSLFPEKPGKAFRMARPSLIGAIQANLWRAIVPALVSLVLLLVLTRPWTQGEWTKGIGPTDFRSLRSGIEIAYAFYIYVAAIIFLFVKGARRLPLVLTALMLYAFAVARVMDLHPYSQPHHYLSLPIFFLFWPIAMPWPQSFRPKPAIILTVLIIGVLLPELQGVFKPWQGLRVVVADWRMKAQPQPLHLAIAQIAADKDRGPVLFDYVPQYANWYLPEHKIALMPDRSTMNKRNRNNPIWQRPLDEPQWHVAFFTAQNGQWICSPHCDYHSEGFGPSKTRYQIVSQATGKKYEMCIVGRWKTYRWNNAPFAEYEKESLQPEGKPVDELTLAHRCTSI